jgi:hypothetical protein
MTGRTTDEQNFVREGEDIRRRGGRLVNGRAGSYQLRKWTGEFDDEDTNVEVAVVNFSLLEGEEGG